MKPRRRIFSIAHSYCVALNRRLADEMSRAGGDEWEITAVAPTFFNGDLRPITLEQSDGELCRVEAVNTYLSGKIHVFVYSARVRELLRQPWDLVHCWEEPYIVSCGQVAWWTPRKIPFVFWTAQNISKPYLPPFSMIEKYCVERCAGWMGSGQLVIDAMLTRRGYDRKPHSVMPLGVDVDLFRPNPAARDSVRTRLGWAPTTAPVVGYMGRFVEEKGVGLLMRALDRVTTPWRALFMGGGPMEASLRNWAARYGDRVRIVNNVPHDEVPAYLNVMDMLCAPSQTRDNWREQFGRMVIEAFACGVPVISSDSAELPFVVGDAGVIAREHDEDAWVTAIGDLIDNAARREELSRMGIERAQSTYAWPVIARAHLDFFSRVLDGSAPSQ